MNYKDAAKKAERLSLLIEEARGIMRELDAYYSDVGESRRVMLGELRLDNGMRTKFLRRCEGLGISTLAQLLRTPKPSFKGRGVGDTTIEAVTVCIERQFGKKWL